MVTGQAAGGGVSRRPGAPRVPVLTIDVREPDAKGKLELKFALRWQEVTDFGPEREPDWLSKAIQGREQWEAVRGLDEKVRKKLRTALESVLMRSRTCAEAQGGDAAAARALKEAVTAYAQAISDASVIPRELMDRLSGYSGTCINKNFPPILILETEATAFLWQLAILPTSGKVVDPTEWLWCRRLALGFRNKGGQAPVAAAPRSHEEFVKQIAAVTRHFDASIASPKMAIATNRLVGEVELMLAAWDPWGLSGTPCYGVGPLDKSFGILLDRFQSEHLEQIPSAIDASALVLYHGAVADERDGLGITRITSTDHDAFQESHWLHHSNVGRRGQSLVIASSRGTELSAGDGVPAGPKGAQPVEGGAYFEPSKVKSLATGAAGGNWIGTPVFVGAADGLRVVRSFVRQACTRGAPIAEILRQAIDEAARGTDAAAVLAFGLHGNPEALLPFHARNRLRMHFVEGEKSPIHDLSEALANNPVIPISATFHAGISDMDDDFLRSLDPATEHPQEPQIWPVSLAAIGRALYGERAANRMRILAVALYSHGGNTFYYWDAKSPGVVPDGTVQQVAIENLLKDPLVLGFAHNSYEGTALRMYLQALHREKENDPDAEIEPEKLEADRFTSCGMRQRIRALLSSAADGAVFWGADYQGRSLKHLKPKERDNLERRTRELPTVDLDAEVESVLFGPATRGTGRAPMIFLVATFRQEDPAHDAAATRASFFALRELLRTLRSLKVKGMEFPTWHRGGRELLQKGQPEYFRSVADRDLEFMGRFIAHTVSHGLWGDVKKREVPWATCRTDLERHLYLGPAEVQQGKETVARQLGCDLEDLEDLLAELEMLMWGSDAAAIGTDPGEARWCEAEDIAERLRRFRTLYEETKDYGRLEKYEKLWAAVEPGNNRVRWRSARKRALLLEALRQALPAQATAVTGEALKHDSVLLRVCELLDINMEVVP